MRNLVYAHTLPGFGAEYWEPLIGHLAEVGFLTAAFAGAFGAADWGAYLGQIHDLGKYSDAFQDYLNATQDPNAGELDGNADEHASASIPDHVSSRAKKIDHSTFGAQYAVQSLQNPAIAQLLAFCIAGHHAGLTDYAEQSGQSTSSLQTRLAKAPPQIPPVTLPSDFIPLPAPTAFPLHFLRARGGFQLAFFARMLFSCLVDADRLATEEFCNPPAAAERLRSAVPMRQLADQLDRYLMQIQSAAPATAVNASRRQVLDHCLAAAPKPRGFFSLNVPTGGGKTLASLAFAFHHILQHQETSSQDRPMRRVVMAIPFTSIIEQTVDVYRKAFGPLGEAVILEHHSNIQEAKATRANKFAAENWDAEVIVTTNVQLYESLFASKTSPCRKLHRLANSVIILDEAQTLPVDLLQPTLLALQELVLNYGCSLVLCTATQPALEHRAEEFDIGIPTNEITPIIPNAKQLHHELDRVHVQPLRLLSDDELTARLAAHEQVLCIVNSRPHAAAVYKSLVDRIGPNDCYHLSTFMCAQHRREKLAEIRQLLIDKKVCRVISTQLIEAGVDVDFPTVYRAPAGFDSIAQAAGRCNREGKLCDAAGVPAKGNVFLFDTEKRPPAGLLRSAADAARELSPRYPNPLLPEAVHHYFRNFYWRQEQGKKWDKLNVMEPLTQQGGKELTLCFKQAAERYKIIRDEQIAILVPFDAKAQKLIDNLSLNSDINYQVLRDAQPYLVGVHENVIKAMCNNHTVEPHESGLYLLRNHAAYSPEIGIRPEAAGYDPENLMP